MKKTGNFNSIPGFFGAALLVASLASCTSNQNSDMTRDDKGYDSTNTGSHGDGTGHDQAPGTTASSGNTGSPSTTGNSGSTSAPTGSTTSGMGTTSGATTSTDRSTQTTENTGSTH